LKVNGVHRNHPPVPVRQRTWDKPTIINNVETLANRAVDFPEGCRVVFINWNRQIPGTKVVAVTGKVKNSGLVEIAMGTPLRILFFISAVAALYENKMIAVQTGGPSGGVSPRNTLIHL
jgi:NADH:ubiquinone oxidoreductase subunit F (NADH-binding)